MNSWCLGEEKEGGKFITIQRKKNKKDKKAMTVNLPWPLAEFILESWVGKMAQPFKNLLELEF